MKNAPAPIGPPPSVGDPVVKQISLTLVFRIAVMASTLATSVLIARMLGPVGRGQWSAALAFAAIVIQLGSLGLPTANVHFAASERGQLQALLGNSIVLGCIGAIVSIAGTAAILFFAPGLLPLPASLVVATLAGVAPELVALILLQLLLGLRDFVSYNRTLLFIAVAVLTVVFFMAATALLTPTSAIITNAAVQSAALVWIVWRLGGFGKIRPNVSVPLARRTLGVGIRFFAVSVLGLIGARSTLLLLIHFRGAAEAGQYSAAATLGDLLYTLPVIVGTVLLPHLSASRNADDQWRLTTRALLASSVAMALSVPLSMAFSDQLVQLLFGPAFGDAAQAFRLLAPGIALLGLNFLLVTFFAARGMPWLSVVPFAAAALANTATCVYAIPRWGLDGAAAATSISNALLLALFTCYALFIRKRDSESTRSLSLAGP